MLYLASQFAWFLLAAFVLGWVMGWLGTTRRIQLTSGPLPYLLGIWLLLAALTWLQGVNGVAALWVETALLYLAAYIVGCVLASALRPAAASKPMELAIAGAPAGAETVAEPAKAAAETTLPERAATAAAGEAGATAESKSARKKSNSGGKKDKPAGSET